LMSAQPQPGPYNGTANHI